MAKVQIHPLLEQISGKIHGLVFRRSHNGQISAYVTPDMSRVKWSPAQVAHRERFAEASAYARAALAKPEIRAIYEQMSMDEKGNKRPYDMAIKHYYDGNNLLGKDFRWNVEWWREMKRYRKKKR